MWSVRHTLQCPDQGEGCSYAKASAYNHMHLKTHILKATHHVLFHSVTGIFLSPLFTLHLLYFLFSALMLGFSNHSLAYSQHWCLFLAIIDLLAFSIDAWFQPSLFSALTFVFSNYIFACSQHWCLFEQSLISLFSALMLCISNHSFAYSGH